jgi:hypothetical protein
MRPYVDGFIVLGEGYVQGMMEGEALQILDKRTVSGISRFIRLHFINQNSLQVEVLLRKAGV